MMNARAAVRPGRTRRASFLSGAATVGHGIGLCLAGAALALWLLSPPSAHASPPVVAVYADGDLPDIPSAAMNAALAAAMSQVSPSGWRFVAGEQGRPLAGDRITWRIHAIPHAGDRWHRIGRLLSPFEDRFGRYVYVSAEVRLFLGGAYQATSFATGEVQGGAQDPKLAAFVKSLTSPLLSMDLNPEQAPPLPKSR